MVVEVVWTILTITEALLVELVVVEMVVQLLPRVHLVQEQLTLAVVVAVVQVTHPIKVVMVVVEL